MKIPTIKLTTLATWLFMACIGGYIGAEYQSLRNAADMQVLQEAGYVNMAQQKPLPVFIDKKI